ncbi:rhodanese-like domain-containing protein [Acinetobacter chinensis]|uniref:Rhodanese-like domain-containing protein n=1 Tax=Acinetobacter chinensis TaxID=2004650 RepID=A0A3B7LYC8_9GAMM|nr:MULTISPECIES: rhodanese-like domain-containing protein [Acinetobacter]AXY57822.1 rhodanese-like domain-containing protein [Acinetobacter chinensis]AXY59124.1 rhodanese-like domain-containing protein [Acinetobacter sp. WCHAc010052]MDV2470264.1 rhodanese-like domain-containing protein [Acinetobacter chinensis]WOE41126.1 rhodanese-like domain-containing protein [Acinetobacter chinensis]
MIRKIEITTFEFPENAVIWDVRDNKAFAESHLKGAVNQPIDGLTADSLTQVNSDQPIYILCGGGSKAPRAAEKLEGFDSSRDYIVLMGGTRAARDAGLSLESDH